MAMPLSLEPQIQTVAAAVAGKTLGSDKTGRSGSDRAHAQATDFEAVFLSSMFQNMFTDVGKDGPLGDGPGIGVWRTFLTNEFGKSLAKAGGIGIANQVYKSLMAHQEAHTK